jgi:hypothetical protein
MLASPDDLNNWLDNCWSANVRRRSTMAAQQLPINKYNAIELMSVHAQIIAIERSEESQDSARTTTERHIKAMIDGLPFVIGDAGRKAYAGSPVGDYDDNAAELRDDEVLAVATGRPGPTKDDYPLALPPARSGGNEVFKARETEL